MIHHIGFIPVRITFLCRTLIGFIPFSIFTGHVSIVGKPVTFYLLCTRQTDIGFVPFLFDIRMGIGMQIRLIPFLVTFTCGLQIRFIPFLITGSLFIAEFIPVLVRWCLIQVGLIPFMMLLTEFSQIGLLPAFFQITVL